MIHPFLKGAVETYNATELQGYFEVATAHELGVPVHFVVATAWSNDTRPPSSQVEERDPKGGSSFE